MIAFDLHLHMFLHCPKSQLETHISITVKKYYKDKVISNNDILQVKRSRLSQCLSVRSSPLVPCFAPCTYSTSADKTAPIAWLTCIHQRKQMQDHQCGPTASAPLLLSWSDLPDRGTNCLSCQGKQGTAQREARACAQSVSCPFFCVTATLSLSPGSQPRSPSGH